MIQRATARVAVVGLPGMNCEEETLRALAAAGLSAALVGWDAPVAALEAFDAYVLPGGFSYQDRVRAGAVAAKDPRLEVIAGRADAGAPVLGICNGAQILVEAGMVPGDRGDRVTVALAANRMPEREGYFASWVTLEARGRCLWTEAYAPGERVPMPVAHAEGRFTARSAGAIDALAHAGRVPFAYVDPNGPRGKAAPVPAPWPANPNGSEADAAGLTNAAGTVLALMPHPERADRLYHVPLDLAGPWGERRRRARSYDELEAAGPGHGVFLSLALGLGVAGARTAAAENR